MPEQYTLQEAPKPAPPPEPAQNKRNTYFIIAGVVIGFICIFALGLVLGRGGSSKTQEVAVTPTPTSPPLTSEITPFPSNFQEIPLVNFLPNKQYLDDTYVVISQEKPYQTLILSVARIEQTRDFTQYTKINYFDGTSWDRKSTTAIIKTSDIVSNPLLRSWTPPVINKSSSAPLAKLSLPKYDVSFNSPDLKNEISVQSNPGSTKFIYQGKGTFTINDDTFPAYVFYSRTYSYNAVELDYLTKPDQILSDWLVFWDKEGTFYYADDHKAPLGTSGIPQFAIGVIQQGNSVIRTPSQSANVDTNNSVKTYHSSFDLDRDEAVFIPITNPLNKSNKKSYSWTTASGEGISVKAEGRKVNGLGVFEYIRQNQ